MCLIFLMCHESKCRTSDLKAQELFNFVFQIKCSIFLLSNGSIFDKLREYDFVTLSWFCVFCNICHLKFHPNPPIGSKVMVFLYPHPRSLNVHHIGIWSYEIKKYGFVVPFNGIICLPNFMEIHRSVQKLAAEDTHWWSDTPNFWTLKSIHLHTHTIIYMPGQTIANKKFWEELIRQLSLRKSCIWSTGT
jgi:hypothetical protein